MSDREQDEQVEIAMGEARLGANGWFRMNCPFCIASSGKEDKRWSLGVHGESGFYHCFKCETKGRIQMDETLTGREVAPVVAKDHEAIAPPFGFEPLWRGPALTASSAEPARQYLLNRGFDLATWRSLRLGITFDGIAANRVIIPVLDPVDSNVWHGWIARDWTAVQVPKYLYPSGMQRGTLLYQQHVLDIETDVPALVVEGAFDAAPYVGDACACLGKPSKWQREALKRSKRPIAVCLDGDAWEEAHALSMLLRLDGVRSGYVRLPPKQDPCSMAQLKGSDWLREEARRAVDDY